jgi:hypothetical protein
VSTSSTIAKPSPPRAIPNGYRECVARRYWALREVTWGCTWMDPMDALEVETEVPTVTEPRPTDHLRHHLKESYPKINRATGIDDYRFAPYPRITSRRLRSHPIRLGPRHRARRGVRGGRLAQADATERREHGGAASTFSGTTANKEPSARCRRNPPPRSHFPKSPSSNT